MMNFVLLVCFLSILAYLLGSIPSAVWLGKWKYGMDVREHGSGNAGATNTFRVLGTKAGTIVLVLDVCKGLAAASLVKILAPQLEEYTFRYVNLQLLFGFLAVIGHLFPVFAQFRGGKGIATLFGMIIGIHYLSALLCLGLFLLILFTTRYVSLGSILSAISFPIALIFIFNENAPLFIAFAISAAVLVVLTHKKNIQKLVNGTEHKAKIFPSQRR